MQKSALLLQTNWRRFQAQLDLKLSLYDRLNLLRSKYMDLMRIKIQSASATLIQRNWRRHVDQQKCVYLQLEKVEADKRIQTLLVALCTAASSMRHHVHPWWRHLPPELQEILEQVKGSLQRTIALVPVTGKLANEEIGNTESLLLKGKSEPLKLPKKGLRVAHAKHLTYVQTGQTPDLASHLFLSVTRHVLSGVPAEIFPATVKWACYAIGHQAAALVREPSFAQQVIVVGKEHPPHPGDRLATLWSETAMIKHHHDSLMTFADETIPGLILRGVEPLDSDKQKQWRQANLIAQVLITMRQALDTPTLSTDDHLKFQGLDAESGKQLMEVLSSEIDHRLPDDLPSKDAGTVASLSKHIAEHLCNPEKMKPKEGGEVKQPKVKKRPTKMEVTQQPKGKAKSKAKGKAKSVASSVSTKSFDDTEVEEPSKAHPIDLQSGSEQYFNRRAMMRILQQVGYFMRDQDMLMQAVLNAGKGGSDERQLSRHVAVTDQLFDMADTAKFDHCSFCLAVVLFHMAMRALCLRVLYHRAAVAIQTRYRYVKQKGAKTHVLGPAMTIQRLWRGLRASLRIMRQDDAAVKIQHAYRLLRWNRRASHLLRATLKIQRVWLGAIHRKWLRNCNASATYIQKIVRRFQVQIVLDKEGREIARQHQLQMTDLLKQKGSLSETEYSTRTSTQSGKLRSLLARHRETVLDVRKMPLLTAGGAQRTRESKARRVSMRGSVQPMRVSEFEPMVFALAKMDPQLPARYGAQKSRILSMVTDIKRDLDNSLPRESTRRSHAGAKRGRAAIAARRMKRKPRLKDFISEVEPPAFDEDVFNRWAVQQFEPKRF